MRPTSKPRGNLRVLVGHWAGYIVTEAPSYKYADSLPWHEWGVSALSSVRRTWAQRLLTLPPSAPTHPSVILVTLRLAVPLHTCSLMHPSRTPPLITRTAFLTSLPSFCRRAQIQQVSNQRLSLPSRENHAFFTFSHSSPTTCSSEHTEYAVSHLRLRFPGSTSRCRSRPP